MARRGGRPRTAPRDTLGCMSCSCSDGRRGLSALLSAMTYNDSTRRSRLGVGPARSRTRHAPRADGTAERDTTRRVNFAENFAQYYVTVESRCVPLLNVRAGYVLLQGHISEKVCVGIPTSLECSGGDGLPQNPGCTFARNAECAFVCFRFTSHRLAPRIVH